MAYEGYYEMQLNFIGKKQRFLYHPTGIRTSKAVLASVRLLPANFSNPSLRNTSNRSITETGKIRAFETITNLLITSPWGEVTPMLQKASREGEVLREARFDFWDTSNSSQEYFRIHIFNTRVLASGLSDPWGGIPGGADAVISKDPGYKWQTFSFTVTASRAQGSLPAELARLSHLSR